MSTKRKKKPKDAQLNNFESWIAHKRKNPTRFLTPDYKEPIYRGDPRWGDAPYEETYIVVDKRYRIKT
jgi:hypothetical protein